jgi:hypothetical protein
MTMTREEFIAAVDWGLVAADMRETRDECSMAIAQRVAEIRSSGRREKLGDKEMLAGLQRTADYLEAWLAYLG